MKRIRVTREANMGGGLRGPTRAYSARCLCTFWKQAPFPTTRFALRAAGPRPRHREGERGRGVCLRLPP